MSDHAVPAASASGTGPSGAGPSGQRPVAFVVTDYVPATGGTTTQTRAQALELVRRGRPVSVVTRRLSRSWPRRARLDGVEVFRRGVPGYGRAAKAVDLVSTWGWLVANRRTVSVVQVVMDADYAVMGVLAGLSDRVFVMWATDGDADFFLDNRVLGGFRHWALRSCRHVALTPSMAAELGTHGLPATVIPVPADLDRFRPATAEVREESRRRLGVTAEVVIAYTGHLERRKCVDHLLQAFRDLVADGAPVHLLLVGGGKGGPEDLTDQLAAYVRDEGLQSRVTFTGEVADVAPFLSAADVFCLPSLREGMPNSILEAMSCALAVVAPGSAGGNDLLSGGAGVIPRSNAPEDLVDALQALVTDPQLRADLGRRARERAAGFSVPVVVDAYEQLWAEPGPRRSGDGAGRLRRHPLLQ